MAKNQLDRKQCFDNTALFAAIAVVAIFAAGFLPEAGDNVVTAARGFPMLYRGTGSFWGDALVMAFIVWACLRWASGIDDVKTIKSKRKKKCWRRILFP